MVQVSAGGARKKTNRDIIANALNVTKAIPIISDTAVKVRYSILKLQKSFILFIFV